MAAGDFVTEEKLNALITAIANGINTKFDALNGAVLMVDGATAADIPAGTPANTLAVLRGV